MIRKLEVKDAEAFLTMLKQLDQETKMMMFEPGERKTRVEDVEARIQREGVVTFIVVEGEQIVGFLTAERGFARRIQHSAYVVIGILEAFRGRKYGQQLFSQLDQWAEQNGMTRLELTVMTHNEPAIHLYEKMGFKKEGLKEQSLIVDGEPVDEFYMAKLL